MQSINDIREKSYTIEKNITAAWQLLISSEFNDGMKIVAQLFADIGSLLNTAVSMSVSDKIISDIPKVNQIFSSLENAMRVTDYILVADLMEYEIKPLIIGWRKEMNDYKGNTGDLVQ